jgi:putative hemolysin
MSTSSSRMLGGIGITIGLLAGLSALSAAEVKVFRPADNAAVTSVQPLSIAPKARPRPSVKATSTVGVSKLTQSECTQLGGEVKDSSAGVCNSNKVCVRTDQNNVTHRVCITTN